MSVFNDNSRTLWDDLEVKPCCKNLRTNWILVPVGVLYRKVEYTCLPVMWLSSQLPSLPNDLSNWPINLRGMEPSIFGCRIFVENWWWASRRIVGVLPWQNNSLRSNAHWSAQQLPHSPVSRNMWMIDSNGSPNGQVLRYNFCFALPKEAYFCTEYNTN